MIDMLENFFIFAKTFLLFLTFPKCFFLIIFPFFIFDIFIEKKVDIFTLKNMFSI